MNWEDYRASKNDSIDLIGAFNDQIKRVGIHNFPGFRKGYEFLGEVHDLQPLNSQQAAAIALAAALELSRRA